MMRRAVLGWGPLLVALLLLGGCRILSEQAACRRNRDCPESFPLCDGATDGGVGLCVEAPDGGAAPAGDAGAADAGTG